MLRVDEGEQEADGDRLHALVPQASHREAQALLVERGDGVALEVEPLGHFLGQGLRRKQRRLAVEGVEQIAAARLRPAARLVDRAEAARDEQAGANALAFQQRIRGDGRAVDEERNVAGLDAIREKAFQSIENRQRRISWNRWDLGPLKVARPGLDGNQIGESAAGIDADEPTRHVNLPRAFAPLFRTVSLFGRDVLFFSALALNQPTRYGPFLLYG